MEFLEVYEGNGQKVYIDPDWLKATDEQIGFFYIPDEVETPGRKDRKELVNYLQNSGYIVITDSSIVTDDTFFFSPCCDKHINKTVEEYVEKKTKKIHDSLEPTYVHEPLTLNFPSEEFPVNIPSLPFILKNQKQDGGTDKVLIETPEQLEIFKKFYEEINDYSFQEGIQKAKARWGLGPEVIFTEDGKSNSPISIGRINYKQRFKTDFVMQEYIETPTEYNTSLRVVTSSSGDILCASLKYSKADSDNSERKFGLVDRYLSNPDNPYYLGSKSAISNTVAGGKSILLGINDYSKLEREILLAHGLDPDNSLVPDDVAEAAINIAKNCRREIGAISGMDFIYDNKNKCWKYLEQQEYPMMYTYCATFGLPYETDFNNYNLFLETQRLADIDARLRALSLTMTKKNDLISKEKRIIRK